MITRRKGDITLYIASDQRGAVEGLEWAASAIVKDFLRRRLFRELLREYSESTGLKGYALLNAHGGPKNNRWQFWDGKSTVDVQDWINEMDGKYLAIFLKCCNRKNQDVESDASIVLHPHSKISQLQLMLGYSPRLHFPGEGYLERNPYRLRRTIEELRRVS
ncbi:MAG TPA: hypothetical protein VI612_03130 [Candidatus Nanoarchaeia archaeon]|nr:hypothetical protein [Candidatus Nanoarchaeia archaeon]